MGKHNSVIYLSKVTK